MQAPPMHVHNLQTESITVDEGRIGYAIANGPQQFVGPGETVQFRPGEVHRFWNAGAECARLHGWVSPPHNFEYYLTQTFDSMKRTGKAPNPLDMAFLLGRYRREFGGRPIPPLVERGVFPLMRLIGRLTGRYARSWAWSGSQSPPPSFRRRPVAAQSSPQSPSPSLPRC